MLVSPLPYWFWFVHADMSMAEDGSFQVQQDTLKSAQELLAKPWPWHLGADYVMVDIEFTQCVIDSGEVGLTCFGQSITCSTMQDDPRGEDNSFRGCSHQSLPSLSFRGGGR